MQCCVKICYALYRLQVAHTLGECILRLAESAFSITSRNVTQCSATLCYAEYRLQEAHAVSDVGVLTHSSQMTLGRTFVRLFDRVSDGFLLLIFLCIPYACTEHFSFINL